MVVSSDEEFPGFDIEVENMPFDKTFAFKFIPEFDGSRENLHKFISCCEVIAKDLADTDTAMFLNIVRGKLSGSAYSVIKYKTIGTWASMRKTLEEQFLEKRTLTQIQTELVCAKQRPNEDVRTYANRVERLLSDLNDACIASEGIESAAVIESLNSKTALKSFVEGLNPSIKLIIKACRFTTLSDAVESAVEEEKSSAHTNRNLNRPNSSIQKCSFCHKNGHNLDNCYLKSNSKASRLPSFTKGPEIKTEPPSPRRMNVIICSYCKNKGHHIKECRKRQYNNARSQNKPLNMQESGVTNAQTLKQNHNVRMITSKSYKKSYKMYTPSNPNHNQNSSSLKTYKTKSNSLNSTNSYKNVFNVTLNNRRKLDSIELKVLSVIDDTANLLVDSGSDVSVLKISKIKDEEIIYTNQKAQLKGISDEQQETYGICHCKIKINDDIITTHPFHIVRADFPVSNHGIIGNDWLQTMRAQIDYNKNTLTVNIEKKSSTLRLVPSSNKILIPARSEIIKEIETNIIGDCICLPKDLNNGLLIANTLSHSKNYKCLISVVNTNDEDTYLNLSDLNIYNLNSFQICQLSVENTSENCEYEKIRRVQNEIRTNHMTALQKDRILNLCTEFYDIFHLEGDNLTYTETTYHSIPTPNTEPIHVKPYRLPEMQKAEVNKQIQQMLKENIITESKSPWNFPLVVVPKKPDSQGNKRYRIVVDFRKLNEKTIGDAYPLPNISDILDSLGNSKFFSTLDLASGFHQIKVNAADRGKTAFSTPMGHFEYVRMPFGLKGAPATFQRLMNNVLTGFESSSKVLVYMDDIVIYSTTFDEHIQKLKEVFSRLKLHNLKLQPDKCEFLKPELKYLGHIINENGILPDPSKTTSVKNFPVPKNPKDIKIFLGLAGYYRKFIKDFAKISQPLTNLLKKNAQFIWSPLCTEAFNILKEKLVNPPILQYPDFTKDFILTCDASNNAIGSVLSQGEINNDLPIAYASRTLSTAEKNYSTTDKELLAITWSVQHFRPYLFGKFFKIYTDHKPLIYLHNCKDPSSRFMR